MTTPPYVPPPQQPPYQPVPAAAPPPKSSSGCLKWGLIGCGILIVLFVAFAAVMVTFVFGMVKHTDMYKEAVNRAQNDPRVVAALGSPIEPRFWVTGSVHLDTKNGGDGDVHIPLAGSKQNGEIHAVATIENQRWKYETLTVEPDKGPLIDLNTPP